jgi:hypothetical protein
MLVKHGAERPHLAFYLLGAAVERKQNVDIRGSEGLLPPGGGTVIDVPNQGCPRYSSLDEGFGRRKGGEHGRWGIESHEAGVREADIEATVSLLVLYPVCRTGNPERRGVRFGKDGEEASTTSRAVDAEQEMSDEGQRIVAEDNALDVREIQSGRRWGWKGNLLWGCHRPSAS